MKYIRPTGPIYGEYVTIARPAGQPKAHLCAAGSIRAMPENDVFTGLVQNSSQPCLFVVGMDIFDAVSVFGGGGLLMVPKEFFK